MNNQHTATSFRFFKLILIKLFPIILLFCSLSLYAEEKQNTPPKVSLGIGGSFSYYNIHHKHGEYPDWEYGLGFGGGFMFESMLTNMFGIHSGIWYSRMELTLKSPEHDNGTDDIIVKQKVESDLISIPFFLITSFGSRSVTFNILSGLCFSAIISSHMSSEEGGSEDIKRYLGYGQMGLGGGLEFIVRPTRFTGFFITGVAEYYFTDLIADVSDTTDSLYNFQIRSGFLLFTF